MAVINICSACNASITDEPYHSISDEKHYCSENCLPEEAFDHPYSFEYMSLMSSFRHFQERKHTITNYDERVELENDMGLVIEDFKSLYFSDSESSFYKAHIIQLYEKLLQLNEEVIDILLKREYESYFGVSIYWHDIWNALGDDLLNIIYLDMLDSLSQTFFFFRNLSWEATNEDEISPHNVKDLLCFLTAEDQQRFVNLMKQVFEKHNPEHFESIQKMYCDGEFNFIYTPSVRQCFVCGHWEAAEDYVLDSERNVHVCNQWEACEV